MIGPPRRSDSFQSARWGGIVFGLCILHLALWELASRYLFQGLGRGFWLRADGLCDELISKRKSRCVYQGQLVPRDGL
jgi:hypothetical protein